MRKLKFLLTVLTIAAMSFFSTSCKNGEKPGSTDSCIEPPSYNFSNEMNWKFEYDGDGRLIKSVDPGGKVTELIYEFSDADKHVLKSLTRKNADGSVIYSFDRFGRLESMQDAAGSVTYEYDGFSKVISVKRNGSHSIHYTYNALDQMASYSLDDAFKIEYEYDFLGRPKTMKTPVGDISYEYWAGQSTVKRTFPNGISTYWKFGPDGKLESIVHVNKENSVLSKYSYSYNADGLISEIKEWSPSGENILKYGYDQGKRLVSYETSAGEKTLYAYDSIGNRTLVNTNGVIKETAEYDGVGKMLSLNGTKCSYDSSGNLISYANATEKATFEFNASNKLKAANGVSYEYDGVGNLLTRKFNGESSTYFPDPFSGIWKPLAEDKGDKKSYYIWEGEHPIAIIENGAAKFFLEDHLGSVRSIADNQGIISNQFSFSPFGNPESALVNDFTPSFTGLFFDKQANLIQTLARAYALNAGRFLQIDPLHHLPNGSQKNLSLYGYCGGDPVNYNDNTGTQSSNFYNQNKIWEHQQELIFINQLYNTPSPLFYIQSYPYFARIRFLEDYPLQAFLIDHAKVSFISFSFDGIQSNFLRSLPTVLPIVQSVADLLENQFEYVGHSVQTITPPIYLQNKTDFGWIGSEQFSAQNFRSGYLQELNTSASKWSNPGSISRLHTEYLQLRNQNFSQGNSQIRNYSLDYSNRTLNVTPGTSFIERFMMHSYPTGDYYDETSSIISKTTVNEKYRTSTEAHGDDYWTQQKYLENNDNSSQPAGNEGWRPEAPGAPGGGGFSGGGYGGGGGGGWAIARSIPIKPSNVGGVYLSGAGNSLEGVSNITGIVVDKATGRIVLLGNDKTEIALPPLRVDDVVTIFRSVYNGEAPYVSIDPNPENPKGNIMLTRHSEATKNTYVGWILYETDRVMKCYSLTKDNETGQLINSNVPGYSEVLNARFLGDEYNRNIWSRFWIVPGEVKQSLSTGKDVSLYDMSLKVNTQQMKLQKGNLVPADNDAPSPSSKKFAEWFTQNYDAIANEALYTPPVESGITGRVAIFKELKRIALITAIAENLRDNGVAFPFWMRDYKVKSFPTPVTTPAITVVNRNNQIVHTIYGGVDLSSPKNKIALSEDNPLANKVAAKISGIITKPFLEPVALPPEHSGHSQDDMIAVAMPGAETKALAPCTVTETDLVVPLKHSGFISLEAV